MPSKVSGTLLFGNITNPAPTPTPSTGKKKSSSSRKLGGEQESAYDLMRAMLREWGLESLAPVVRDFLIDGRTPEQIGVLLQDTPEYKTRFAGNEERRKRNLAVLSPGDYLATEAAYRQIMESAGLPSGFYDQPSDFAQWIGNDVAPLEVKNRVDAALDVAFRMDPDTARAFKDFYGITQANLAAFFLDRDRGLMELEKISRAGMLGGAATSQGLDVSRQRAEQLATSDLVGPEDYRSALGQVQRLATDVGRLGGIYDQTFGQREAEQEVFFADEETRRRRRRLGQLEEAQFGQGSGASPGSLAQPVGQT